MLAYRFSVSCYREDSTTFSLICFKCFFLLQELFSLLMCLGWHGMCIAEMYCPALQSEWFCFLIAEANGDPVLCEEHVRAMCILSYSDNAELQRSAALCFTEVSERSKYWLHLLISLYMNILTRIKCIWQPINKVCHTLELSVTACYCYYEDICKIWYCRYLGINLSVRMFKSCLIYNIAGYLALNWIIFIYN